jgi:hypothetical protein
LQETESVVSFKKIVLALFILAAVAASVQSLLRKEKVYTEGGKKYTCYNNYIIFKQAHHHLISGTDLYKAYPEEQWDLYKYSPAFALFFGGFAYLPDFLGLTLWNLLNALLLALAVYFLPLPDDRTKSFILLACLIELVTSMQNEQSNPMIAGLLVLAFGLLQRDKFVAAAFCIVFSVYVKIFGLVGFALFLFYPHKWKLILWSLFWGAFLFVVPLIAVAPVHLKALYADWGRLLISDESSSYGLSVMGLIRSWTGWEFRKMMVVGLGALVFLLPFLRFRQYGNYWFKLTALCSVLLWIVIFNHKAESPTFIIAMTGVAIWFFSGSRNRLNTVLFILALIFTSLSPTDIFPPWVREHFFRPYLIKVIPCILIWVKIVWDMMSVKGDSKGTPVNQ